MLYLTLRQYQYVVAVAEAGSLTDAAAALHVSQPSLSVAITRVEARLGRAILVRGKGLAPVLTPFGHRFVGQARDLLRAAVEIETASDAARPIVLGCFEDLAPWYLPKTLATLRARFPSVSFMGREGRFSDLALDIAQGRVDLAISYDVGLGNSVHRHRLAQVAPVAFVAADHPLAALPSIELHQLDDQPLILSAEELSLGYLRQLFQRLGVNPNVAHKTASLEMMRSLAAHGAGVGISYSCPPTRMSYDGQPLATVPIRTPEALADIVLIWSALGETDPRTLDIIRAIGLF